MTNVKDKLPNLAADELPEVTDFTQDILDAQQPSLKAVLQSANESNPSKYILWDSISPEIGITVGSQTIPKNVDWLKRATLLVLGDVAAIAFSAVFGWYVASLIRFVLHADAAIAQTVVSPLSLSAIVGIPTITIVYLSWLRGHYSRFKPVWNEMLDTVSACAYSLAVGVAFLFLLKEHVSRLWFLSLWLCIPVCVPLFRLRLKKLMMKLGFWFRPVVVVGTGRNAALSAGILKSEQLMGYDIVAFVELGSDQRNVEVPEGDIVYGLNSIEEIDRQFDRPEYLFAMDTLDEFSAARTLIDECTWKSSTRITLAPPLSGLSLYGAELVSVFKHDNVLLNVQTNLGRPWARGLKRLFDIIVSMSLMIFLAPLFLILYALVRSDGGQAFYVGKRLGYKGRLFNCFKFRSMATNSTKLLDELLRNDAQAREQWISNFKFENDPRITKIGRFIRKSSLDELPQLWNVLIGDMSLVGPRPIAPGEEVVQYGDLLSYYAITRPGITGLWQVSGRSSLSYPKRIELNLWYTKNWSLWNDIIILLKTVPIAIRGEGAH